MGLIKFAISLHIKFSQLLVIIWWNVFCLSWNDKSFRRNNVIIFKSVNRFGHDALTMPRQTYYG